MNHAIRIANVVVAAIFVIGIALPHLTTFPSPFRHQTLTLIAYAIVFSLNYFALAGNNRALGGIVFLLNLVVHSVEPTHSFRYTQPGVLDWMPFLLFVDCVFLWRAYPTNRKRDAR